MNHRDFQDDVTPLGEKIEPKKQVSIPVKVSRYVVRDADGKMRTEKYPHIVQPPEDVS